MDYKSTIGEKVVRYDGTFGIIIKIDSSGFIHIKYEGDSFDGGYMFDPFLAEQVKFVDPAKQKIIDEKIQKIDEEEKAIILAFEAKSTDDETYFITLAKDETPHHENGIIDKVIGLSCSEEDAYRAFNYYIKQEGRKMRKTGNRDDFHQVGLYDAKSGQKIGQET